MTVKLCLLCKYLFQGRCRKGYISAKGERERGVRDYREVRECADYEEEL